MRHHRDRSDLDGRARDIADRETASDYTSWPESWLASYDRTMREFEQEMMMAEEYRPSMEYAKKTCKPNTAMCCRYLMMAPDGWSCGKHTSLMAHIDNRVFEGTMRATGDNCDGRGGPNEPALR